MEGGKRADRHALAGVTAGVGSSDAGGGWVNELVPNSQMKCWKPLQVVEMQARRREGRQRGQPAVERLFGLEFFGK